MAITGQDQKFGKYLIHEELGHGGFGTVFRATDTALDLEIALKLLDTHLAARDPALVQGFVREGRVAARLTHPSIVRVYDVGDLEGARFIAMQYLPGGSLADVIRREAPLSPARVVELLRPIAEALDFAHDQGFVHRDVKPSNILFDRSGRPVLVDFGLVRAAEGTAYLSLSGRVPGTVQYAAPEQLSALRGREIGAATDVYALGVVAYQMLTGQVPFDGDTTAVIGSQLHDPPPPPRSVNPAIPQAVEQVVLQALAKDPTQRPACAVTFVQSLAPPAAPLPVLQEAMAATAPPRAFAALPQAAPAVPPVLGEPPAAVSPPARRERSAPAWALIGVGALAVILLIVGVGALGRGGTSTPTATPLPPTATPLPPTATPLPPVVAVDTATMAAPPPITGTTRVRDSDGGVMVWVPAGEFTMGSGDSDSQAYDNEKPQQRVTVAGFWIDRTEVTNAQYRKFVDAGGYTNQAYWTEAGWAWKGQNNATQPDCWGDGNLNQAAQPVVCVSWYEAYAYARWAGGRLPTEAEWEKAARGPSTGSGDGRIYPWGNEAPDCKRLNYADCVGRSAPVGSYANGVSPYGVLDLAGNVWEWVNSENRNYPYNANDGREDQSSTDVRVLRGGSWLDEAGDVRSANRVRLDPGDRYLNIGFRVASPGL